MFNRFIGIYLLMKNTNLSLFLHNICGYLSDGSTIKKRLSIVLNIFLSMSKILYQYRHPHKREKDWKWVKRRTSLHAWMPIVTLYLTKIGVRTQGGGSYIQKGVSISVRCGHLSWLNINNYTTIKLNCKVYF